MANLGFSTLVEYFQAYGVVDFLLPFVLVFTIVYAVAAKMPLFSEHKNFRVIIALVLALLFVVPHITGTYGGTFGYDPVQVMNESLPSISLVAVAAIMLLLLMGIFGASFTSMMAPWIALVAIGFVVYIFGASLKLWTGPYDIFYWWTTETTELIIIILVFGLIVWFITKEPESKKSVFGRLIEGAGKLVEKKY
ncbi:MAG: hypothetical protein AB1668_01220 [Nanoarchaeota archaeon]